jgi:FAD/FMN-containing dehydrogenase
MADLQMATISGSGTTVKEVVLGEFQEGLRGGSLRQGDQGYDEARKVWNGMVDKRPALIAQCAGVSDVVDAVNFARTNNLLISVRGGGHNFPGAAVCNGGLVIDLSKMRSVRVDPVKRTARAEGGSKWGDFDHETQAFGLATPGGTDPDTGIGGLTLGGGIGWLSGEHGLSSDNLISADVVTSDGQLRRASEDENEDLLWALRGGGGNFGVVTSFEYQLHPVGPQVIAGLAFYPYERARDFLKFYADYSSKVPDGVNTVGGLGTSPEGAKVGFIAICYHGPLEEGKTVLQPVREFGPPLADHIQPMPYTTAQRMLEAAGVSGRQYYIKSHFMNEITDDAIDTMLANFEGVASPLSSMIFQQLGNATNRVPRGQTAFGHRDAWYEWATVAAWLDPGESEIHVRWARDFSEAMDPFTFGFYVNQVGTEAEEGAANIKAAYGANFDRLVSLKQKYDPMNLFSHNQNIRPAA